MEPRALHKLGKCSTTELYSQLGLTFLPALASDSDPPTYASCIVEITGVHHRVQFVGQDREVSQTLCPGLPQATIFTISAFQVAGITVVSHCAQPSQ
jgi:hypothetical protein